MPEAPPMMIAPDTSELATVRRWITAEVGDLVPAEHLPLLLVAVTEAVTNAIEAQKRVACTEPISIGVDPDRRLVEIEDCGGGFEADPDRVPVATPNELRGRGLLLMKQICPDLSIETTSTGTTVRLPFPSA
ncbi:MAG: ATP-binding protein [Actinomycetota bacterium]